MKKIFLLAIAFSLSATIFAQDKANSKAINSKESKVNWTGKKVTGEHSGTIIVKDGSLTFSEDGMLTGGSFTMDMTSITCTDLEGDSKTNLEGHLASEDFFGVEKFPSANMVITNVEGKDGKNYKITAELTIKDITQTVTFDAEVGDNKAMANIVIDRTKYEIKYKSGTFFEDLGDKVIYDDFDLNVELSY